MVEKKAIHHLNRKFEDFYTTNLNVHLRDFVALPEIYKQIPIRCVKYINVVFYTEESFIMQRL
jgi:hypothetical protein